MSNLAIDIKNRREELGLTVKEMADSIGLSKDGDRVLRLWESGNAVSYTHLTLPTT